MTEDVALTSVTTLRFKAQRLVNELSASAWLIFLTAQFSNNGHRMFGLELS